MQSFVNMITNEQGLTSKTGLHIAVGLRIDRAYFILDASDTAFKIWNN